MTTDPTARAQSTPAPVAVPEGGWREDDWFALSSGHAYLLQGDGRWEVFGAGRPLGISYAEVSFEEWAAEGKVEIVHAPREDAPRPEPDHEATVLPERFPRVQGRCPSCGRGSLMLASGGYVTCASFSCRDPEAASKVLDESNPEPVVAPLPTEAKEAVVAELRRRAAAFKGGNEGVRSAYLNAADLIDRLDLPAADQRARDEGTVRVPRRSIDWLRERNDVAKSKTNTDSNYVDAFLSMTGPAS